MTKTWFKAAGIRALKTVCQTAVASIGTAYVLADVDFLAVASASVLAGLPEVDGTVEEPSDQEDETVEEPSDEETEEEEEITSEDTEE